MLDAGVPEQLRARAHVEEEPAAAVPEEPPVQQARAEQNEVLDLVTENQTGSAAMEP